MSPVMLILKQARRECRPSGVATLQKGTGLLRFLVRNHVNQSLNTPFWGGFYWSRHDWANHERKRRGFHGTNNGGFCKLENNANKATDDSRYSAILENHNNTANKTEKTDFSRLFLMPVTDELCNYRLISSTCYKYIWQYFCLLLQVV